MPIDNTKPLVEKNEEDNLLVNLNLISELIDADDNHIPNTNLQDNSLNSQIQVSQVEYDNHISKDCALNLNQVKNTDNLVLNQLIADGSTPWQVHNCKIIDKNITQNQPMLFIYHYDALSDELKSDHPLTPNLLKHFQTPMTIEQAATVLKLNSNLLKTPWQIKVTGTLVLFCEPLQIALRLKFTNTAKNFEAIHTQKVENALKIALKRWHFYGDVFVLNKNKKPLVITCRDDFFIVNQADSYKLLPAKFSLTILADIETLKDDLPLLDNAVKQHLIA